MNVHNSSDTLENRNLDNIRLLAGLEPTARQVIASQCVFQKFSPETFLLDRDQQSDDVLFIMLKTYFFCLAAGDEDDADKYDNDDDADFFKYRMIRCFVLFALWIQYGSCWLH